MTTIAVWLRSSFTPAGTLPTDDDLAGTIARGATAQQQARNAQALTYNATPIVLAALMYLVLLWPVVRLISRLEHKAVAEAGVIGKPDPVAMEVVKAFVVLDPAKKGKIKAEDIQEWAKDKMTHYKIPSIIEFRDELPVTLVGKILRRVLKQEEIEKAKKK